MAEHIIEKFVMKDLQYSVNISNSSIDSVRTKKTSDTGIRVFADDGRMGLSAGVGKVDEAELTRKAEESLGLGFKYDYEIETDKTFKGEKGDESLINPEYLLEKTQKILDGVKSLSKNFVYSHKVNVGSRELIIKNSGKLHLQRKVSKFDGAFLIKKLGSANIMDGFVGFESYGDMEIDKILQDTEIILQALESDEVKINQQEINVAFLNNDILGKFSGEISGDSYHLGTSLLAGRLNEKIFSDKINISDIYDNDPFQLYVPFDHEGFIRKQNLNIVEAGVLKHVLFDKKNGAKFGAKTTGHGFRSYTSNPSISQTWLYPRQTHDSLKSITSDELTLIPMMAGGGDFLPNGDFSTPVQFGIIMKNGKVVGRAPQITISGNYLDLLGDEKLIGVGLNDVFNFASQMPNIVSRMNVITN